MNVIDRPATNGATTSTDGIRAASVKLKPRRNRRLYAIVAAIVIVALIAGGVFIYRARTAATATYVTIPAARQTLVQTVTATGTVNPQNTISVGTQVSGTISELDADYNSKVKKGQLLAKLDTTALQQQLDSAEAQLAQSEAQAQAAQSSATGSAAGATEAQAAAQVAQANARAAQATALSTQQAIAGAQSNVAKSQAALSLAQQTVTRDAALITSGYIPQTQVDTDRSNLVAAQTALQSAQVAVQQARSASTASNAQAQSSTSQISAQQAAAQVANASAQGSVASASASQAAIAIQRATVEQAQTNLSHAIITSPVDGTVISRAVSVGQTVASSLQTPTLFSIAQDLSKMEVDLAVGEPDIGSVKFGQHVTFTVLAYPNRTFDGTVSQVRKNPTVVQNVVTYDTVVLVDNKDNALLPGMTANASIGVATQPNTLVVPTAALAFQPTNGSTTHRRRTGGAAGATGATAATGSAARTTPRATSGGASPWGTTTGSAGTVTAAGTTGRVFVQQANGTITPVGVKVTLVAGTQAAVTVTRGTLNAGDNVVVSELAGSGTTRVAPATLGGPNNAANATRGIH